MDKTSPTQQSRTATTALAAKPASTTVTSKKWDRSEVRQRPQFPHPGTKQPVNRHLQQEDFGFSDALSLDDLLSDGISNTLDDFDFGENDFSELEDLLSGDFTFANSIEMESCQRAINRLKNNPFDIDQILADGEVFTDWTFDEYSFAPFAEATAMRDSAL